VRALRLRVAVSTTVRMHLCPGIAVRPVPFVPLLGGE
jgi:hypothetical protein